MSERETAAYRAGYRTGQMVKIAVLVFALSIGAVVASNAVPQAARTPVEVAAIVIGAADGLLLGIALRQIGIVLFGMYIALVGVGSALQSHHPRPKTALIGIAIATIVTALSGLVVFIRQGRRTTELDRLLFTESTSLAFFVTMLFVLTYGLLEVWVKAPKLSMWVVWSVGMLAWIVLSTIFRRRYS